MIEFANIAWVQRPSVTTCLDTAFLRTAEPPGSGSE